jgi:hypothetical protein
MYHIINPKVVNYKYEGEYGNERGDEGVGCGIEGVMMERRGLVAEIVYVVKKEKWEQLGFALSLEKKC